MAQRRLPRPIGGFMGIELPAAAPGNLRARWQLPGMSQAWSNARSALAALLVALPRGAVWLPAYLCPELALAVAPERRRYYGIDASLSPRVAPLEAQAVAGDIVLAVDYFGRAPGAAFLDFVARRRDLMFVEDCAQALDTAWPPWGDWQLYSPRKLVGVPDGGMLVCRSERAAAVVLAEPQAATYDEANDIARAHWARFEDVDEQANAIWHALHQAKEAALAVAWRRISRLSWELLGVLDATAIGAARRRNFALLAARLEAFALLPDRVPSYAPLGFPVRVPAQRRAALRERLCGERIFAPVHWERLPSPVAEFPAEHELAASVLTLPCDHRYSAEHMDRVAAAFEAAMR